MYSKIVVENIVTGEVAICYIEGFAYLAKKLSATIKELTTTKDCSDIKFVAYSMTAKEYDEATQ